jgi:hypothetical protein
MSARSDGACQIQLAILLLPFVISTSVGMGGEERPASYTASQLRARILDAQHSIHSLYVTYHTSMDEQNTRYPRGASVYRQIAVMAPFYYYHLNTHYHDQLAWQDDPLQQSCYVTGDRQYVVNRVNRTYGGGAIGPTDRVPGSLENELFFLATGLWPLDRRPAPRRDSEPYLLCDIAQSPRYDSVASAQEEVDGRWCHILEYPGKDRLWLDVERGCILLKRETRSAVGGPLACRFQLGGYREVQPGIWLPGWIRNVQFDFHARTEQGRRRKVTDALIEILEGRANELAPEFFQFQPEPGTLSITPGKLPEQNIPGGHEHLDHLIQWWGRTGRKPPYRTSVWNQSIWLAPFLLVLVFDAWRTWRRLG